MVVALLAVTIGGVAIISTRVAHVEMHKLEVHRIPRVGNQPPKIIVLRRQ